MSPQKRDLFFSIKKPKRCGDHEIRSLNDPKYLDSNKPEEEKTYWNVSFFLLQKKIKYNTLIAF